jgi:hypothetical protein
MPDPDGSLPDMGALPFDPSYCLAPRNYCTPKVNSLGCTPTVSFTGTPTLDGDDDFHMIATGVFNRQSGIMIWSRQAQSIPFQGGRLCLRGGITRTRVQNSGGSPTGTDCSGKFDFHFSHAYFQARSISLFQTIYAQYWYRDPHSTFSVGLTDGGRFVPCPSPSL